MSIIFMKSVWLAIILNAIRGEMGLVAKGFVKDVETLELVKSQGKELKIVVVRAP